MNTRLFAAVAMLALFLGTASATECSSYSSCSTCVISLDDCMWCGTSCMNSTALINSIETDIGNCTVDINECSDPDVPVITSVEVDAPANFVRAMTIEGIEADVLGTSVEYVATVDADETRGDVEYIWHIYKDNVDVTNHFSGMDADAAVLPVVWDPTSNVALESGLFKVELKVYYQDSMDFDMETKWFYLGALPTCDVSASVATLVVGRSDVATFEVMNCNSDPSGALEYRYMVGDAYVSEWTTLTSLTMVELPLGQSQMVKVEVRDLVRRSDVSYGPTISVSLPTFADQASIDAFVNAQVINAINQISGTTAGYLTASTVMSYIVEIGTEHGGMGASELEAISQVTNAVLSSISTQGATYAAGSPTVDQVDELLEAAKNTVQYTGYIDASEYATTMQTALTAMKNAISVLTAPVSNPSHLLIAADSVYGLASANVNAHVADHDHDDDDDDSAYTLAAVGAVNALTANVVKGSGVVGTTSDYSSTHFHIRLIRAFTTSEVTSSLNVAATANTPARQYDMTVPMNTVTSGAAFQTTMTLLPPSGGQSRGLIDSAVLDVKAWNINGVEETITALTNPIALQFDIDQETHLKKGLCSFWDTVASEWSTEGCTTVVQPDDSVVCQVDHLTAFSVLSQRHSSGITGGAVAGIIVAVLAIAAIAVYFLYFRKNKGHKYAKASHEELRRIV